MNHDLVPGFYLVRFDAVAPRPSATPLPRTPAGSPPRHAARQSSRRLAALAAGGLTDETVTHNQTAGVRGHPPYLPCPYPHSSCPLTSPHAERLSRAGSYTVSSRNMWYAITNNFRANATIAVFFPRRRATR